MSSYRVSFDGKWQERFDDRAEAVEWAKEVAETGRMVHVVRSRLTGNKLIATFPEGQADEGRRLWKVRASPFHPGGWDRGTWIVAGVIVFFGVFAALYLGGRLDENHGGSGGLQANVFRARVDIGKKYGDPDFLGADCARVPQHRQLACKTAQHAYIVDVNFDGTIASIHRLR
jgi:hypothetical protein